MGQQHDQLQNSFTAGELSPRLHGRSDLGKYANGVSRLLNHTVWAHGGAPRRMGSRFVASAMSSESRSRLVPFQFSTEQAYILEFGHQKMRVFMNRGQILNPDDSLFEISTPWTEDDLAALAWTQSADVMYLVHPGTAPQKLTRNGHANWSLASISFTANPFTAAGKYPRAVAFYEQRLVLAGTDEKPQTLWFSVTDDYENFTTGSDADKAIEFTIAADQVNTIRWLSPGRQLAIGTAGGEWICEGASGQPIAPDTITVRRHSRTGSGQVAPVRVGAGAIFVQAAGRKMFELAYDFNSDAHIALDLTELAEHLTRQGLVEIAYQQEPDSILWCVRKDGALLGFTYSKHQDVMSWHRHILGGTTLDGPRIDDWNRNSPRGGAVESVACIPRPDDSGDDLWLVVRRTVNGETCRYIEHLESSFEPRDPDDREGMVYLDSCVEYRSQGYDGWWFPAFMAYENPEMPVWTDDMFVRKASETVASQQGGRRNSPLSLNEELLPPFAPEDYRIDNPPDPDASLMIADFRGILASRGIDWPSGEFRIPAEDFEEWMVSGDPVRVQLSSGYWLEGPVDLALMLTLNQQDYWCLGIRCDLSAFPDFAEILPASLVQTVDQLAGLDHLEGETVSVLADGAVHPERTVENGRIALASSVSAALAGFPYWSEIETLDLLPRAAQGAGRGKMKRVSTVDLDLFQSSGGQIGQAGGQMATLVARSVGDGMNSGPPLQTSMQRVPFPGNWNKEARVKTRQTLPLPFTPRSLVARIEVTD